MLYPTVHARQQPVPAIILYLINLKIILKIKIYIVLPIFFIKPLFPENKVPIPEKAITIDLVLSKKQDIIPNKFPLGVIECITFGLNFLSSINN